MNTQIILDFVYFFKEPLFKDFEILGQRRKIKFGTIEKIKIQDEFFDDEYKKMIQIKVLSEEIENIIEIQLNKNVDNFCYFFCDDVGKTYHLLFNQEKNNEEKIDINIPTNEFHFNKYDTNGTKYRKRFILANASFSYIKINQVGINLSEITKDLDKNATSFQLSIYNLQKKQIVSKALEMPKPTVSLENIYKDNHQIFE